MREYRDMVVVFSALALVAVLVLIASLMPGPVAGSFTTDSAKIRPQQTNARLRFGEPVMKVAGESGTTVSSMATRRPGSASPPLDSTSSHQPLHFTDYVFAISVNGMRKAIESISPALVECYQQWSSLDDNVGMGVLRATFLFHPADSIERVTRVKDVRIRHPSPDVQVMEQCVLDMFRMLRFEAEGPRKFKHPLVFGSTEKGS